MGIGRREENCGKKRFNGFWGKRGRREMDEGDRERKKKRGRERKGSGVGEGRGKRKGEKSKAYERGGEREGREWSNKEIEDRLE